ncbi:MAG TPA: hemerythrin domain-containing protein [Methylomirabilota bacterium]|nr:hemerythrin domain-containing protein [Methylomirabilota bacterium]
MTSPTSTLRQEHRVILRALALLEVAAARQDGGPPLPDGLWEELLDWFHVFADRTHHAKEEQCLFPALGDAGVPAQGGPVGVMLDEHTEGRALLQALVAGPAERREALARRYGELLRAHIDKENGVLLPLAEVVLDPQTQQRVARGFEDVETQQGPAAVLEHAEAVVDRLAAALADA